MAEEGSDSNRTEKPGVESNNVHSIGYKNAI